MTYELAKQLKDTGFPQPSMGSLDENEFRYYAEKNGERAFVPSLSELIAACGEDFLSLNTATRENGIKNIIGWCAISFGYKKQQFMYNGETPHEAVAKLWLALNEISPAMKAYADQLLDGQRSYIPHYGLSKTRLRIMIISIIQGGVLLFFIDCIIIAYLIAQTRK